MTDLEKKVVIHATLTAEQFNRGEWALLTSLMINSTTELEAFINTPTPMQQGIISYEFAKGKDLLKTVKAISEKYRKSNKKLDINDLEFWQSAKGMYAVRVKGTATATFVPKQLMQLLVSLDSAPTPVGEYKSSKSCPLGGTSAKWKAEQA